MEELRALSEADIRVQVHLIIKKVGDRRVEEIRLELVSSIANAVETWKVIPFIAIHVLWLIGIDAQVVLGKIQSTGFATAGTKRHVVHEGVIIFLSVFVASWPRYAKRPMTMSQDVTSTRTNKNER